MGLNARYCEQLIAIKDVRFTPSDRVPQELIDKLAAIISLEGILYRPIIVKPCTEKRVEASSGLSFFSTSVELVEGELELRAAIKANHGNPLGTVRAIVVPDSGVESLRRQREFLRENASEPAIARPILDLIHGGAYRATQFDAEKET